MYTPNRHTVSAVSLSRYIQVSISVFAKGRCTVAARYRVRLLTILFY